MKQILETGEYFNHSSITNSRICAGALLFLQVGLTVFHAFFVRPPPTLPTSIELPDLLPVAATGLLVIVGFSLVLSPAKNRLWSSIGFALFVTAVTFQLHPLVCAFWTNAKVTPFNNSLSWTQTVPVFLSDRDNLLTLTHGNSAMGAFKCALANIIALSALNGRVGILEALLVTFCGNFFYQLNRQLLLRYALDLGGSISIFCWGGLYGSVISVISYCVRHKRTAQEHDMRVAGKFSYALVGIGSLLCFTLFPFLAADLPPSLTYHHQAGIATYYSMTASVLTCVGLSCLINGRIDFKDFVYSPVVGAVIAGSSAAFISNSAGAMILGALGGVVHVLLQRWQGKIKWYFLIQNNVLFLFGVQGALGGLASAVFVKIAQDHYPSLYPSTYAHYSLPSHSGHLAASGITIAIGVASGLVVGVLVNAVSREVTTDHYHDRACWITEQDCLSASEDIHLPDETERTTSSADSERNIEVYKEVIIHHEKGFKDKFVPL